MQSRVENSKPKLKERSIQFSLAVFRFIDSLPNDVVSRVIIQQLIRAATSIGANIHEAFGSGTKRDFANFFSIALKSAKETEYWLILIQASRLKDNQQVAALIQEVVELERIIASSILTIRGKN